MKTMMIIIDGVYMFNCKSYIIILDVNMFPISWQKFFYLERHNLPKPNITLLFRLDKSTPSPSPPQKDKQKYIKWNIELIVFDIAG